MYIIYVWTKDPFYTKLHSWFSRVGNDISYGYDNEKFVKLL